MSEVDQIVNNIKDELQKPRPNTKTILKTLFELRTNKKIQQPSDSEFFDIVGVTFRLSPEFFMNELYIPFMNKMGKVIGDEKRQEMEKHIIEKYCLTEGEQILYECKGDIKQTELLEQKPSGKYKMDTRPLKITVSSGDLFFTNYRIIAHGLLKASGGEKMSGFTYYFTSLWVFTGGTKREERKRELIESSKVFGYQFPIKNHIGLNKVKLLKSILYNVNLDKRQCLISIKPTIPSKREREEDMSEIFKILRKDESEVLDVIHEVYETEILEKMKRRKIVAILKALRISEEFTDISDSEFLDIVSETFKLDPEFFMTSVYPKLMTWKVSSSWLKEQMKLLIDKLCRETGFAKPEQGDDSLKFIKE